MLLMVMAAGPSAAFAAAPAEPRQAWFYSMDVEGTRWCAATSDAAAQAASQSEWVDAGESVRLRYHGAVIDGLTVVLRSEDAFVEDDYRLFPDGRVRELQRRGAYGGQDVISVVFQPDARGHLQLNEKSRAAMADEEKANRETYFIAWDHYTRLSDMPFMRSVVMEPVISISQSCPLPSE